MQVFFLKSHCLYNYFNIQHLIKVKLLFSALVFTIISYIDLYIITDYHNLANGGVRCIYDLFDFILYVHSTIFQLCGTVLPGLNQY